MINSHILLGGATFYWGGAGPLGPLASDVPDSHLDLHTYEIKRKTKITAVLSERVRGSNVRSTDLNPAECEILPLRHIDWLLILVSGLIFIK